MYDQLTQFIKDKVKISDEDLELILPFFKSFSAKKNELLVSHGELGQQLFFVKKRMSAYFFY